MTEHLSFRTRQQYPIGVVDVVGELDDAPVSTIADALREHLAEQPAALLVDLSELRPTDATPRLLADALHAVRSCDIPVLLVTPDPALAAAALQAGATDVVSDTVAGLRRAADYPAPRRRTLRDLPPDPQVLRTARDLAGDACESWGIDDTAAAAQLVTSELLSNAIEHTGTSSDVTLALRGDQLHIVVRDGSRALPMRPPDPGPGDPRGRGLVLIDQLAVAWAVVRTSVGKLVWAVLPVEGTPGPDAAPRPLARNLG